jgi:hypothetical protein
VYEVFATILPLWGCILVRDLDYLIRSATVLTGVTYDTVTTQIQFSDLGQQLCSKPGKMPESVREEEASQRGSALRFDFMTKGLLILDPLESNIDEGDPLLEGLEGLPQGDEFVQQEVPAPPAPTPPPLLLGQHVVEYSDQRFSDAENRARSMAARRQALVHLREHSDAHLAALLRDMTARAQDLVLAEGRVDNPPRLLNWLIRRPINNVPRSQP